MNALLKILIVNKEIVTPTPPRDGCGRIRGWDSTTGEFEWNLQPLLNHLEGSRSLLSASGSRWDGNYCQTEAWREGAPLSGPTVYPFFISVL